MTSLAPSHASPGWDDVATFLSILSPYSRLLENYWGENIHQRAFKMMTHHNMALVINGEFLVSVTGGEEQPVGETWDGGQAKNRDAGLVTQAPSPHPIPHT